jgi:glycosyltransferase involved in cell wall biosynthesis
MPIIEAEPSTRAKVAYLSNLFPCPVEPYVSEEIEELERRGVAVTPCSVWRSAAKQSAYIPKPLKVFTLQPWPWLVALALCIRRSTELRDIFRRLFVPSGESWRQRARGLAHTVLGARLALLLRYKNVRHIHIHHGYLAAWIGMVAARLLRIPYSLTLHGSDLLVRPAFLDIKLRHCAACFTVSEFNRCYLLHHYPNIDPEKVIVQRMGVSIPPMLHREDAKWDPNRIFTLLAVGRLHPVKDHAFLIRACAALKTSGNRVLCCIAGEGPERARLRSMIHNLGLADEIQLLGHVPRHQLPSLYAAADLVVLTSRSEGIPLTLMEAMALGRLVLPPAITGIPELVSDGKTGFLFNAGSITDFVRRVEFIQRTYSSQEPVRAAARAHVEKFFNLEITLQQFGDSFLQRILGEQESVYADSLLQQVQL